MHLKFLPHSTGSGSRAVSYLLQERDHKNEVRAGVRVLRGNPDLVAQQIDSLDFVHRYSSGVIAWHLDDNPTEQEISDVLDSFEETAFAGLSKNQYSLLAVEHRDADGRVHVHVITPRVDLESGKSLNISPPGWIQYFDPWREYHNHLKGWARVEDPERARIIQPGSKALGDESRILQALKVEPDSRQMITDYLITKIVNGLVKNRHDIRRELAKLGEITREGKAYISVKPEGFSKAIRLKGAIYDEKFTTESLKPDSRTGAERPSGNDRKNPEAAEKARNQLEKNVERRAKFHRKKYPHNPESNRSSDPEHAAADAERAAKEYAAVRAGSHQSGLSNERELVLGSADQEPSRDTITAARTERQHDREPRLVNLGTGGSDHGKDPQRNAATHTTEGVDDGHRGSAKIANERAREHIDREAERKRKARGAADRALERFIRRADTAIAACRAARRSFDRGIKPLKALTQKLRRFGGLTALKAAQKAKRSFAKYGKIWKRQFTRKQRAEQLVRTQFEQSWSMRDVRPLHDHVVQERESGSMPDPTR